MNLQLRSRLGIVVLAFVGAALACAAERKAEPELSGATVDLLSHLEDARRTVPEGQPENIARWTQTVGGDSRAVVFMHPPSRAVFPPARLTLDARLEISLGVNEVAWDKPGDGVEFYVSAITENGEERRLFSTYVDPKSNPTDRRWIDAVVTLGTYAGQKVSLVLETGPGPAGDIVYDWAGWSRAELILGTP